MLHQSILKSISQSPISVVRAKTGSGKSTTLTWQIYQNFGKTLSIQPRLQNAIGISSWMSYTGRNSGCITGTTKSANNELDYCTTGCAVWLIENGIYDVVIFDEIQDVSPESNRFWILQIPTNSSYILITI